MAEDTKAEVKASETSQDELCDRCVQLVFGGDQQQFQEFCEVLRRELPPGTGAVIRGSAVTGVRWDDGAPFDADGPGTSDVDLTLIGGDVHSFYILDGYFVPGIHSKPLSDKDPDIAPKLIPLREKLQQMVKRPVNIQATRDFVMYIRENLFNQPYLTLIEKADDS